MVKDGQKEELKFMEKHHVWEYVRRSDVFAGGRKPKIIGTRWVLVRKGSGVRARLVANEFADEKRAA